MARLAPGKAGFVSDPAFRMHDPGIGHPECPARFDAVDKALEGLALTPIPARAASEKEIQLCHHADYVALAKHEILEGAPELSTGDTFVCEESWEAAVHAVGGTIEAVKAVFEKKVANAFCAVRPPGHHATPSRGMGFCVFNNVAIAARYAQRHFGAARVLIADWDVHHGNGTQDIFFEDPSVLFFSTHQSPLYPGTGAAAERGSGKGLGTTINRPFPEGATGENIVRAFRETLMPAAEQFRPDLVMVSAGFDSRDGDPLGGFRLADDDFAALTHIMADIADSCAGGRLVSVLEGGYNLAGLASACRAHVGALIDRARVR